jgi:hypothetical protein
LLTTGMALPRTVRNRIGRSLSACAALITAASSWRGSTSRSTTNISPRASSLPT